MMRCGPVVMFLFSWLWNQRGVADTNNGTTAIRSIIKKRLDSIYYDNTIRPLYDSGGPVRVEVDVVLNTLGPVSGRDMDMKASFYLRQQWRDPRLDFSAELNQTILLNHRHLDFLWLPDLFFSQSKTEETHDVTVPNVLLRLYPDGTILYSQRLSINFQCFMDLRKFPLDEQTCFIRMESYSHTTQDMYFVWSSERKSMEILDTAYIPDFALQSITTHDCSATYATGTYPCLEARLRMKRQIGFYMLYLYVPCILIVILSWVSFWLDPTAIPARISVGLLTVLTITTQSSGNRTELPKVPYTKAVDVWLALCLVFVFAAYMQYAVVTVFSRAHRKLQWIPSSSDNADSSTESRVATLACSLENDEQEEGFSSVGSSVRGGNNVTNGTVYSKRRSQTKAEDGYGSSSSLRSRGRRSSIFPLDHRTRDLGHDVDKWSRFLFPLAFVLFNVGYWVFYTHRSDPVESKDV